MEDSSTSAQTRAWASQRNGNHEGAKESSRARILDAAQRLFVEQGYKGLSMREIAQAVGVSKPALYHYFIDKEDLFLAILGSYLDDMEVVLANARAASPTQIDCLRTIVRDILQRPIEQRAILRLASVEMVHISEAARVRFHERYVAQFLGPIGAVIGAGMTSGEFRTVDPALATWALLGILYPYFSSSSPPPTDAIIEQVIGFYLHGIAA